MVLRPKTQCLHIWHASYLTPSQLVSPIIRWLHDEGLMTWVCRLFWSQHIAKPNFDYFCSLAQCTEMNTRYWFRFKNPRQWYQQKQCDGFPSHVSYFAMMIQDLAVVVVQKVGDRSILPLLLTTRHSHIFPWCIYSKTSETFRFQGNKADIYVYNPKNLWAFLLQYFLGSFHNKDRGNIAKEKMGVHEVGIPTTEDENKVYAGNTKRSFTERFQEHHEILTTIKIILDWLNTADWEEPWLSGRN